MKFVFFGGNSQVAVETAAHLQRMGHSVFLYGRGLYPQTTLQWLGLNYAQEPNAGAALTAALLDVDLAIDFAFPAGEPWDAVPSATARVQRYLSHLPEHARFAVMSSISAYGMGAKDARLRWHTWPLTAYAAGKRQLEANSLALGRQLSRKVVAFRLGQVHGVLQSASQAFRIQLAQPLADIGGLAQGQSASVFTDGVATALAFYAAGHLPVGVHPLIDQPQWRLATLLDFYHQLDASEGTHTEEKSVRYFDPEPAGLVQQIRGAAIGALKAHRGRIEPLLFRVPKLARFVKTRYRQIESSASTHQASAAPMTCHYGDLSGVLPLFNTPNFEQTQANWHWFDSQWRQKILAALR